MTLINNLKNQLERDEGLKLKPYKDTVGKLTIGVGRNLTDRGINAAEADFMLDNDIALVYAEMTQHLPWALNLSEARQGVLLNMIFNMGIGGLLGFKNFLMMVQAGEYANAAEEMLNSKWASDVGPRAHRLSIQMGSDQWA